MSISLRPVALGDSDVVFEWMKDPESAAMAAFGAADRNDRVAFDSWFERATSNPDVRYLMIWQESTPVGTIGSFLMDGAREVSYWVARSHWGLGIASAALAQFLMGEGTRPLFAHVAAGNLGSQRVVERAGFVKVGSEDSFAPGVGAVVEEYVYRLG